MSMPRVACTRSASDDTIARLQQEIDVLRLEKSNLREDSQMWNRLNLAVQQASQPTKRRGRKKPTNSGRAARDGPFYHTNIKDLEAAAEAFVRNSPFWGHLDIFSAVSWAIEIPDKDQQILIRAYTAKMLFPDGMAEKEFDVALHIAKAQLQYAASLLCGPQMAKNVFSQFVNAFTKRSPKKLALEAAEEAAQKAGRLEITTVSR